MLEINKENSLVNRLMIIETLIERVENTKRNKITR